MSMVHPPEGRGLLPDVEHAHRHALAALDDPSVNSLAAVPWVAAHLAAVDRVLYPAVERTLPDGRARVRAQRAVDHRLQQALYQLDRRLTGDVHLQRLAVHDIEDEVRRDLRAHADGEHVLVEALSSAVGSEGTAELSDRLARALPRSPTRPHPDLRHGGLGSGLLYWAESVVDRTRDLLDSRVVSTPRPPAVQRPVTRWGAYALGVQHGWLQAKDEQEAAASRPDEHRADPPG